MNPLDLKIGDVFYLLDQNHRFEFDQVKLVEINDYYFIFGFNYSGDKVYFLKESLRFVDKNCHGIHSPKQISKNIFSFTLYTKEQASELTLELKTRQKVLKIASCLNNSQIELNGEEIDNLLEKMQEKDTSDLILYF
jgi:hypothetical protein